MSATVTINGLPVCGYVGAVADATFSTDDCWASYHKWVEGMAEKDAPLCVLREPAQWAVNGMPVATPRAWFITLSESCH